MDSRDDMSILDDPESLLVMVMKTVVVMNLRTYFVHPI